MPGKHVKPAKRVSVPGVVFAVVVHTATPAGFRSPGLVRGDFHSAECAVSYRRRGKWSAPQVARFGDGLALHEWMMERAIKGRINWVISPHAADSLTLTGWWKYADERGVSTRGADGGEGTVREGERGSTLVSLHSAIASYSCDIIDYADAGKRFRWVSERNYWPDGTPDVRAGGRLRRGDEAIPAERGTPDEGADCAMARVSLARLLSLCDWWTRNARSPFGRTAGQLAWGILRTHVKPKSLTTHDDDDAHRLERACSHGGRASVWYCGAIGRHGVEAPRLRHRDRGSAPTHVPGPVHHLDVSSMYPTLLRDRPYPVALERRGDIRTPAELRSTLRSWGVVARVRVRTQTPEYPVRRDGWTIYPVGEFITTLAGPELEALLDEDGIVRVYDSVVYRMGEPFRASMDALLHARATAAAAGDDDGATFAKLLANSLAGKLAQRSGKWVRDPDRDCRGRWGESREISHRTSSVVRVRHLAGLAWRYDATAEHRGPHTAAYAYLTAYGRRQMAAIRGACPERSVVSQDTDGLWALDSAVDALRARGILAGVGPGRLRIVGSADSGRFYGPRHYCVGGRWVLSGYAEAVIDPESLTVLYVSRAPLFASLPAQAPDHVLTYVRQGGLPAREDAGRLREDGWIDPPHILPGRQLEE